MASDDRKFDVVVFGATGFTGERVAKYWATVQLKKDIRPWAIAGRNQVALEAVRKQIPQDHAPQVLIADCSDYKSILAMAQSARVIINCVGPYRFFGEVVVRACVEAATHYVDVTGEPEFMERMLLKYDDEAKSKGVLIVSACGFDSIPADLGFVQTLKHFDDAKVLATNIQSFLSISSGPSGVAGNFATFESAVHGFGSIKELKSIRRQLKQKENINIAHAGKGKKVSQFPSFDQKVKKWVVPFPGSDASVVKRTSTALFKEGRKNIPRYYAMYAISSTFWMILGVLISLVFSLMAATPAGRRILLKYPKVFSLGVFSNTGPSEQQLKETSFRMRFFAEGYRNPSELANLAAQNAEVHEFPKPDVSFEAVFRGPEPGYVTTPICVVQSALVILEELHSLPRKSGVLSPGAAFGESSLIDRLRNAGVIYEVIKTNLK